MGGQEFGYLHGRGILSTDPYDECPDAAELYRPLSEFVGLYCGPEFHLESAIGLFELAGPGSCARSR